MKKIYALILSAAIISPAIAQTPTLYVDGDLDNDDSGIYLEDGAEIYVESNGSNPESVHITANGEIRNDGTLFIEGDYTNDRGDGAITDAGSGARLVRFVGNNEVDLNGVSGNLQFHNLEVDMEAAFVGPNYSGSGGAKAYADITVNGLLDLSNVNGDLIMNTYDLTIGLDGDIVANGSDKTHFTTGTLNRWVKDNVVQTYEFPISREDVGYVPAEITMRTAPQNSVIKGSFNPVTGSLGNVFKVIGNCGNIAWGQNIMINEMINDFGYWRMAPYDDVNPTTYLGNSAVWDYDIVLHPTSDAINSLVADYGSDYFKFIKVPSHANSSPGSASPLDPNTADWNGNLGNSGLGCSGLELTSGYSPSNGVLVQSVKTFSDWGVGGNSGAAGLPVELLYLEANAVDNEYINVSWATATETENAGFEVLRSTDGTNFQQVGWVPSNGTGNSTTEQNYSFNDIDVEPNTIYYYRLNQVDFDGDNELSYIVNAMLTASDVLTIGNFVPNPTANISTLQINTSKAKDVNVTVYNTIGQIMSVADYDLTPGTNNIKLNMSDMAAGTYYTIITVDNEVYNKKLVVTR